jgi:Cu(I)/Ag(I) efflux system membrane protein CusA/SilA
MRSGENALRVIERVRAKLVELEPSLPPGVKIVTTYDRGELIERSIDTLREALIEELMVVSLIILIFLLRLTSALVPIVTITVAVIISFIPMFGLDITANIMSLAGIAIAIGAMVDASIVVVEQAHKKLEQWEAEGRPANYKDVIIAAAKEVGGPSFYSLLVIAVSFIPIFALEAQEGRLFKPLAFTKNLSMATAAILSITLVPAVIVLLIRVKNFSFRPRWLCGATKPGRCRSKLAWICSRPACGRP